MDRHSGFISATLFDSSLPPCQLGDTGTPAIRRRRQPARLQSGVRIAGRGPRRSSVSRSVPAARPDNRRDTSWRVVLAVSAIAHAYAASTRAARVALGWSIEKLAAVSDVDIEFVMRIEAGDPRVDIVDVLALACVLAIDPLTTGQFHGDAVNVDSQGVG